MLPSTKRNVSASASSRISWLNPAPHALVVYASPQPSPTDVQHSLPGGRYPLPGRDFHPLEHASFSWRTRFSAPAYIISPRRAERRSRLAAGHRRRRREAVLTAGSTAQSSIRSRAILYCRHLQYRSAAKPRGGRIPGSRFCTGSGIDAAPGWDTRVRPSNLTARDLLREHSQGSCRTGRSRRPGCGLAEWS
jgi:hypothetical protein